MNKGGSISSIPKAKSSMNSNYTIDSESYLGMMVFYFFFLKIIFEI
jgi:hypothetical protein